MSGLVGASGRLDIVESLLSTRPVPFKGMNGKTLPKEHGIYLIVDSGTGEFLWAGKSDRARDGLQNRIWVQHRNMTETSDLARILIDDEQIGVRTPAEARKWMEIHCAVHYLTKHQFGMSIDEAEGLVITALSPKYNIQKK